MTESKPTTIGYMFRMPAPDAMGPYTRPCIQAVEIAKRTPKKVWLARSSEASNYCMTADPGDVYETFEAARDAMMVKILDHLDALEKQRCKLSKVYVRTESSVSLEQFNEKMRKDW